MKKVEFINPDNMGKPQGIYTHTVRAGDYVFTSGQVSVDPDTGTRVVGDFETEAKFAFENLTKALEAGGATLADVVKVQAFLSDADDFPKYNEIYKTYFKEPYPARTTVCVNMDLKIEIEAIAYIGK